MLAPTHRAFALTASTVPLIALSAQWTCPGPLPVPGQVLLAQGLATGLVFLSGHWLVKSKKRILWLTVYGMAVALIYALSGMDCRLFLMAASAVLVSTFPDVDRAWAHRSFPHAVWIPMGLGFLAWKYRTGLWMGPVALGASIGWTSHLVGDAFSHAGVAWCYPFQQYERFPDGSFYVKGRRGPFVPLYAVGDGAFWFMPAIWLGIGWAAVFAWPGMAR